MDVAGLGSINLTDPRWAPHYKFFLGEAGVGKSVLTKKFLGAGLKVDEESIDQDLATFDAMVRGLSVKDESR